MSEHKHDDHVWLTSGGVGWAIRRIRRGSGLVFIEMWRGYDPVLEFTTVVVSQYHDWGPYCREAVRMLDEHFWPKVIDG